MPKDDFYSGQTDITAAKIKFYQDYIGGYLIKLLMTFGKCFVADLFCGPGKNGSKKGSPLVLLEEAEKMLASDVLLKKFPVPEVRVFFNDIEGKHISNLVNELTQMPSVPGLHIAKPENKTFKDVLSEMTGVLAKKEPKFFFLDPFTYSDIKMGDIKTLIDSPYTEVLLFLPTFHAYRFSGVKTEEKTEIFLNNFTSRGISDYTDIYDFNESIQEKLSTELGLSFVRPILLDGGSSKNTLFFLTKHVAGIILINKLVWDKSSDGKTITATEDSTPSLFSKPELAILTTDFKKFAATLEGELKHNKQTLNTQIIAIAAKYGFLSEHARKVVGALEKAGKIKIKHVGPEKKGLYISDSNWNTVKSIIEYIG